MDFKNVIENIRQIVLEEEPILYSLDERTITEKRNPQNRTIKELLGHLIDSASNNHQRMVRLQYNKCLVFPDYTQDNDLWIKIQDYNHSDWHNLIQLWKFYTLHIVQIIETVDRERLDNCWYDHEHNKITLAEMIRGYAEHLKLHVAEIHELISH